MMWNWCTEICHVMSYFYLHYFTTNFQLTNYRSESHRSFNSHLTVYNQLRYSSIEPSKIYPSLFHLRLFCNAIFSIEVHWARHESILLHLIVQVVDIGFPLVCLVLKTFAGESFYRLLSIHWADYKTWSLMGG